MANAHSQKPLKEQISVVAEFHAHKIAPHRIAFRTGIELQLVNQLLNGECHQRLFSALLASHRRSRRDQRLKASMRIKGIAQASLQDTIEQEYNETVKSGGVKKNPPHNKETAKRNGYRT